MDDGDHCFIMYVSNTKYASIECNNTIPVTQIS